jgi:cyclomaltodextrinase / maltogenic alpha-amylase / neopullulanase
MKPIRLLQLFVMIVIMLALPLEAATDWFAEAIWYQIFPERFRNGDPGNDPTPESLKGTWPYFIPRGWQVVPWTSDWYELQPWERADNRGFYVHAQLRRYGGDLQGILDKLDYLQALGVNALYLNPVFESASLHKYGATLYHHVDKHFGPDPPGDLALFAEEDAADPGTWQWSSADRLFLKLIKEVHDRDMRIIIDGVFNHVGIPFWAFQRAKQEGPDSRFAPWFHIKHWDDPNTPEDEFDYQGWAGIKDLPEFHRDSRGFPADLKDHFRAVLRRWMDPNGDGDPSDGIDGWRLDVAAEVPLAFWKEFRGWVKAINPEAYLTGEIWWQDYQNVTYHNALPWLNRAFDSVMNYRFGDAVFQFFIQPNPISAKEFAGQLDQLHADYGYQRSLGLQNLYDSHDTARIGSCVVNPQYRQDHGANLQGNRSYQVRKPNAVEKEHWRQMVAFQFLAPGAPFIYYGDECGMWGADDPDCRKPMLWDDLRYDAEQAHPFDLPRPKESVEIDQTMLRFYQEWVTLRRSYPVLQKGDFRWLLTDNGMRLIAFQRRYQDTGLIALFNASKLLQKVAREKIGMPNSSSWKKLGGGPLESIITVESQSFSVYVNTNILQPEQP